MRLQKTHFIFIFIISITLMIASFSQLSVDSVQAQCKNVSSCKNCHEVQGVFPVSSTGQWHTQHALYDFCDVCHGGNKVAPDKITAHIGVKTSFADLTQSCTNCHTSDLDVHIKAYSDSLGVQVDVPIASAICTPTPAYFQRSDLFANPALNVPTPELSQPSAPSSPIAEPVVNQTGNTILKISLIIIVLGGFIFIYKNEKHHFLPLNKQGQNLDIGRMEPIDDEEISSKFKRLSPDGQAILARLLDDPDEAEKILGSLHDKGVDK
jgi:hypothetical protein